MSKVYIKKVDNIDDVKIDLANINIEKVNRLNKLKGHSKTMSYLTWLFLKEKVLEEYNLDIDKLTLTYNQYGKPIFKEFYFNVSHSENVIAIALSDNEIGIDIQLVKNDTTLLAKKMNIENNNIEVTKRFSAIEAYYKKIGTGINLSNLKEVKECKQEMLTIDDKNFILSVFE